MHGEGGGGGVKIEYVGLTRLNANSTEYFTSQTGATPFMPPEFMQEQTRYSEKLDIFPLDRCTRAGNSSSAASSSGAGWHRCAPEIHCCIEDLSELEEGHSFKPLILSCPKDDPKERPDIVTIHTQLLAMVEGVEVPAFTCLPDCLPE